MTRPTLGNPSFLPPRERLSPGENGAGRDESLIFAMKAQANLLETIRDLVRRVEALENRINRTFVSGG